MASLEQKTLLSPGNSKRFSALCQEALEQILEQKMLLGLLSLRKLQGFLGALCQEFGAKLYVYLSIILDQNKFQRLKH